MPDARDARAELIAKAIRVLDAVLDDPETPPAVQLQAASRALAIAADEAERDAAEADSEDEVVGFITHTAAQEWKLLPPAIVNALVAAGAISPDLSDEVRRELERVVLAEIQAVQPRLNEPDR